MVTVDKRMDGDMYAVDPDRENRDSAVDFSFMVAGQLDSSYRNNSSRDSWLSDTNSSAKINEVYEFRRDLRTHRVWIFNLNGERNGARETLKKAIDIVAGGAK
jgi:hypothetical protein